MRVLVTRPLPDGERTAAALRARGHRSAGSADESEAGRCRSDRRMVGGDCVERQCAACARPNANQLADKLPLFAVGERGADAARQAGFADVRSSRGDASDLVRLVAERHAGQTVPHLYLAGEDRAADVEGELAKHGITARTVVIYKSVTVGFSPELIRALETGALEAALHFSRRSAENYLNAAKDAGLTVRALALRQFCISGQAAEPLRSAGARNIALAARPDEAGAA